ncbi:hypothetical protein ACFFTN_09205 [Aminobacter aganoensis]|uniref:Uncharacterized protein n=1 Tax=Aminobacter aganoensis TaxID=83264 RepID=A0A7X0F869_9HYPH|nr:hypothetical protein [Aminobacter aganoensis]MBB6354845.1 hypothetical protein [Aminobacter aganoensis]
MGQGPWRILVCKVNMFVVMAVRMMVMMVPVIVVVPVAMVVVMPAVVMVVVMTVIAAPHAGVAFAIDANVLRAAAAYLAHGYLPLLAVDVLLADGSPA